MRPYVHRIRYYECDGMGVTHHSNYLRIMEEARLDLLEKAGFSYRDIEASGIISPVVKLSIRYVRPTVFDDEVTVETRACCATAMRLKFEYVMKVRGEVVCTADNINCFIKGGKPQPIESCLPGLGEALGNQ